MEGGVRSSLDHPEPAALSLGLTKTARYLPSNSRVILNLFQDPYCPECRSRLGEKWALEQVLGERQDGASDST